MKAVRSLARWARIAALVWIPLAGFMAGCETDDPPKTGGLSDYFENNPYESAPRTEGSRYIRLTPASATASFVGQVIRFQVDGGTGPYAWDVSNRANGSMVPSRPNEGLYTVNRVAPNSVMVFDVAGRSATASIKGGGDDTEPEALSATATPSTLATDGARAVLKATGGTPPYRWALQDNALGSLDADTGASVVYTRNRRGDNSARVTDSAGATVAVVIQQP